MKSGIYSILNTAIEKRYIGSSMNVVKRWGTHRSLLRAGKHGNSKLQRSWNKYGETAFRFFVLEYAAVHELLAREQHWLNQTGVATHGYNICITADRRVGVRASDETRRRMREAQLGKRHSSESRARMSVAKTGARKPSRSAEHRAKLGATHRGKIVSEDTRAKLREARKTYRHSDETRQRMSEGVQRYYLTLKKLRIEAFADAAERAKTAMLTQGEVYDRLLEVM